MLLSQFGYTLLVLCAPSAEVLRVDVGHADTSSSTADVQAGFFDLSAANIDNHPTGRAAKSKSRAIPHAFGVQELVTVSLEAANSAWSTLAFRDRGDVRGALGDLAEDFVFNEAALSLTLKDLKPGVYAMTTWHHDAQYEGGLIDIHVNGALAVGALPQTTGRSRDPAAAAR